MIWNIEYQIAGLILMLLLFCMNIGLKKVNGWSEKTFTRLLVLISVCIFLDLCSVFAINYRYYFPLVFSEIICKTYLVAIVVVAWQASFFAVSEIRYTFPKFWVNASALPVLAQIVGMFIFPVYYHSENGGIYPYGPSVILTFISCGIYLTATMVSLIVLWNVISYRRKYAVGFWIAMWLVTALVQFFDKRVIMVSFAMALSCIYMYIKLENPERHLDNTTGAFNKEGFYLVMSENMSSKQKRSLVIFSLSNINKIDEMISSQALEKLFIDISRFAFDFGDVDVFRLEDNEFCIALKSEQNAETAINKLIRRFGRPFETEGVPLDVSISLVYIPDTLVFSSVDSMYEIIHYFIRESVYRGNSYVLTVDERELQARRASIEIKNVLEWAFENDGIDVFYQPIYDIKNGKFTSLEALVRIRTEDGHLLHPEEFIEFAEKNGMILKLGDIVFRKVCEFIQRSHIESCGVEFIEVNLSVIQCMQDTLARDLENIMGEYNIPPYRINFEITESAAVGSKRTLESNMAELISQGAGFSLDDYGSGYSNLSNVVGLPLKIIKIDKTLVDAFFNSEKVRTVTESTIEMVHKLGMKVVVEGVETKEQYLEFKKLNVDYIQGFYFSKPLPYDKVVTFIREWS